jgi:hypothetical protein
MTPDETKQAAAVMIAWADGKKIQTRNPAGGQWLPMPQPDWDWQRYEYRIAPEPLEVEVWFRPEVGCVSRSYQMHSEPVMIAHGWTLRRATIHPEEVTK